MAKSPWKTLGSMYVFKNPWYKVRQDKVLKPDGSQGTYNVVESGPSVFIIAITDNVQLVLVRLFRYPTDREGWELPCGWVEENESVLDAAKRELQEETGYVAKEWHKVGQFDSMNGITNSVSHVYVARKISLAKDAKLTEEGISEVKNYIMHDVLELINNGDIVDGLSIASLLKFLTSDIAKTDFGFKLD